jgi:hypothetical protein
MKAQHAVSGRPPTPRPVPTFQHEVSKTRSHGLGPTGPNDPQERHRCLAVSIRLTSNAGVLIAGDFDSAALKGTTEGSPEPDGMPALASLATPPDADLELLPLTGAEAVPTTTSGPATGRQICAIHKNANVERPREVTARGFPHGRIAIPLVGRFARRLRCRATDSLAGATACRVVANDRLEAEEFATSSWLPEWTSGKSAHRTAEDACSAR